MAIQTRTITATISEPDGTLLEDARVIVTLRGLGNGVNGAVAPMSIERVTDDTGVATFTLWENDSLNSDTYYEISSFHPTLGTPIHKRETFQVLNSDADVKDLINVAPVVIDPTQALLDQVAADRAAAAASATAAANSASSASTSETNAGNSATNASNSATAAQTAQTGAETAQAAAEAAASSVTAFPSIHSQHIQVITGVNRVIELGPDETNNSEAITYSVLGSSDVSVAQNIATFNSAVVGQQILTVIASVAGGPTTEVLLIIDVIDPSGVTTYSLPDVEVA